jgi:secretion/DNA translocation related CpaE-like protein
VQAARPAAGADPPPRRVALLSRDRALIDHVGALADAARAPLLVRAGPNADTRSAPLVLIGMDVAAELPLGWRGGMLVARVDGADPPEGLWKQAVDLGADHVVLLPEGEPWLIDQLIEATSPVRRAAAVGVIGGCGGAGASTLALGLAVTAARQGARPVLIDADPLGGGLDLPLGAEALDGLRWPELPAGLARFPAGLIDTGLPIVQGVRVLTCDRNDAWPAPPDVAAAAMDAACRESDLGVADLPRVLGPAELEVLTRCRLVLLVVPGRVRAVAAAAQLATALAPHVPDLRVVVRAAEGRGLPAGEVADALSLPLAGRLSADPGLSEAFDRGEAAVLRSRGVLAGLCRDLIRGPLRDLQEST